MTMTPTEGTNEVKKKTLPAIGRAAIGIAALVVGARGMTQPVLEPKIGNAATSVQSGVGFGCAPGRSWHMVNGVARCLTATEAAPILCLAPNVWTGSTCQPPDPFAGKVISVMFKTYHADGGIGYGQLNNWYTALRFIGQTTSTRVEALDWGGVVRSSCNIAPGQTCELSAGGAMISPGRLVSMQKFRDSWAKGTDQFCTTCTNYWRSYVGTGENAATWAQYVLHSAPGGTWSNNWSWNAMQPMPVSTGHLGTGMPIGESAIAFVQMAADKSVRYHLAYASSGYHVGCGFVTIGMAGAVGTLSKSQLQAASTNAVFYSSPVGKGGSSGGMMGCS